MFRIERFAPSVRRKLRAYVGGYERAAEMGTLVAVLGLGLEAPVTAAVREEIARRYALAVGEVGRRLRKRGRWLHVTERWPSTPPHLMGYDELSDTFAKEHQARADLWVRLSVDPEQFGLTGTAAKEAAVAEAAAWLAHGLHHGWLEVPLETVRRLGLEAARSGHPGKGRFQPPEKTEALVWPARATSRYGVPHVWVGLRWPSDTPRLHLPETHPLHDLESAWRIAPPTSACSDCRFTQDRYGRPGLVYCPALDQHGYVAKGPLLEVVQRDGCTAYRPAAAHAWPQRLVTLNVFRAENEMWQIVGSAVASREALDAEDFGESREREGMDDAIALAKRWADEIVRNGQALSCLVLLEGSEEYFVQAEEGQ